MNSKNPKQVRSFRLSAKHDELLSISAYANKTSKTKVLEHCIDRYYKLKTKQKMSNTISWGKIYEFTWWGNIEEEVTKNETEDVQIEKETKETTNAC